MVDKKHKSRIDKAKRETMADEILKKQKKQNFPAPNSYSKISHDLVERKYQSSLGYHYRKGDRDRISFTDDGVYKALNEPGYHKNINMEQTRKRAPSARYNPIG